MFSVWPGREGRDVDAARVGIDVAIRPGAIAATIARRVFGQARARHPVVTLIAAAAMVRRAHGPTALASVPPGTSAAARSSAPIDRAAHLLHLRDLGVDRFRPRPSCG